MSITQPVSNVKTLGVFKVMGDDSLVLCGYYEDMEAVLRYFKEVKVAIDHSMQFNLEGDYLVLPVVYFNLKRKTI
jgi:hypothetical protein